MLLGVNIDHVATLRNARGENDFGNSSTPESTSGMDFSEELPPVDADAIPDDIPL